MAWVKITPRNAGGGRKRTLKTARLTTEGQLSMSHAVADMLGTPDRVLVEVEPEQSEIRLTPTTPDNSGGFTLSGGGNSSFRVRLIEVVQRWPKLIGDYTPRKMAAGVLFTQAGKDD